MPEKLYFNPENPASTESPEGSESSETSKRFQNPETSERSLPADRFRVDPTEYPIFQKQYELDPRWGNNTRHYWNIDKTLSHYVSNTANLISTLDGTSTEYKDSPELKKPDHIIYLDKSARPVSWLVNTFWSDFSDQKRPAHSYLNIDRQPWLRRSGATINPDGYLKSPDGTTRRQSFRDFNTENIPPSDFARIRSLYIPGGIASEDVDAILQTPSSLDGKNILIIDEIKDSGSTLNIAQWLIEQSFPTANSVRGAYFWPSRHKVGPESAAQMLSIPVWYDRLSSLGRGVDDVNPKHYEARHEKWQNNKTRAQNFGSIVLSASKNLAEEPEQPSRELMREIKLMRQDLLAGKILFRPPKNYEFKRSADLIEAQGIRLAPENDPGPDTYLNIIKSIDSRPAAE